MSFDLHCNGKNSFHSQLMKPWFIRYSYGKKLCKFHETGMYLILAKHLQHPQKREFYRSFNTDHTSSSYLDLIRGTAGRRALVKLWISNHKLMIGIGRYNQTTKDNRHCPFSGCNVIEDEVHFLFQCPTYSMIRNKFYYKVKTLIPNITQLSINGLINELMNSSN